MHEFGLCQAVLTAVERRAAGRKVTGIRVRVGTLHRLGGPAFEQTFSLIAAGTVAEDATVDLVVIPVQASCRSCGEEMAADEQPLACARCGSTELDIQGGDELTLEALDLIAPGEAAESRSAPCA